MEKEKTGIPGIINEHGEKEYTLYVGNCHRSMAYQKVDGSGRIVLEEYTNKGWRPFNVHEKTAREMAEFFVRECVQCGAELINNHCNCEGRGQ